jgi:drug/metabolite transporter (DMT)-like permease
MSTLLLSYARRKDTSPGFLLKKDRILVMPNYVMNAREWGLLLFISVTWGLSFFFIEIVLRELGPFTLVFYRIGIAALIAVVWLYSSGRRLPGDRRSWSRFFVLGAINNLIPFSLITWGQVYISSSLASILNATTPLFAAVLAHKLTSDEQLTGHRIIGILLGIIGVSLLVGPEALYGISSNVLGQFAILAAAISYACGGIYTRQLKDMPVMVAMTGTLVAASVLTLPLVFIYEYPVRTSMQWSTFGALLGISVFGTAFAYMLYFHIIRTVGVTNTLLVTFLVPVTALLLGVLVLKETLSQHAIAGMLVIFAGLVAVDGRLIRKILA